jgi:hypothetical protein
LAVVAVLLPNVEGRGPPSGRYSTHLRSWGGTRRPRRCVERFLLQRVAPPFTPPDVRQVPRPAGYSLPRKKNFGPFCHHFAPTSTNRITCMNAVNPSRRCHDRHPAWPDAVKIVSRRKRLARNFQCLLGELRSQRRATRVYSRNPSPSALAVIGQRRRRLDAVLGRYMRTLAELRGAVETVFPAGKLVSADRRPSRHSRP